jgi:Zn-dependent peptidase ImmA (M78 family)/DNA-binding XRE family transcriptional regulator
VSYLGDVVAVARKAKGMTQAELGALVGVTQVAVNRYESGDRDPDDATIAALASVLGVTEKLLRYGPRFRGALAVEAHMRRQASTKVSFWRRQEARLNLLRIHSSFLFEEVSLRSEQQVPTVDPEYTTAVEAARLVRGQWRMPIGPVVNLTRWMESAGCLVFEEDFGTHRIDGLSQWVGDHPVILINAITTPDRRRLTLAHELGHLVMHSNDVHEDMEGQASAFAAEFLMPETVIRPALRRVETGALIELKREWGVSIQALYERAFTLGLVTPTARARFYRMMNARGWKSREPGGDMIALEHPQLARHIGETLVSSGLSEDEINYAAGYVATDDNPFQSASARLRVV